MDSQRIVAKLREHQRELEDAGILHLELHGSKARGDDTPDSDADLIAEFDRSRKQSLLGRVHLAHRMTDILGVTADLADKRMLRPEVLARAQRESILVF